RSPPRPRRPPVIGRRSGAAQGLLAVRPDREPDVAGAVAGHLAQLLVGVEVIQRPALQGELLALGAVDGADVGLLDLAADDLETLLAREYRLPVLRARTEAGGGRRLWGVLVEPVHGPAGAAGDERHEAVDRVDGEGLHVLGRGGRVGLPGPGLFGFSPLWVTPNPP